MLRWFHAIMPKEERFFDLFARHSETVVAGAQALRALMEGGDAVPVQYQVVMDREHDADHYAREILLAVRRTFITPFDRGSIKDLVSSMDNTIDQMQKTAKAVMLFNMRSFTPQMRAMADDGVRCAMLVREGVPLMRSLTAQAGRISAITEQISQIEGHTDDLHDNGLKALYEQHAPSDPMAFFAGSEVYDHLEKIVDRFDDVANEMQGIVIEHV